MHHAQPARGGEELRHRGHHHHAHRQDRRRHARRVRRGARGRASEAGAAAGDPGVPASRPAKVNIPPLVNEAWAGMSAESIIKVLSLVDPADPLKPLIDNIVNGNILGVCLFAGCNDVKITQDKMLRDADQGAGGPQRPDPLHRLRRGSFARHGLLTPAATEKYAGPGLKAVLTALGKAAGLGGPLPLALHTGSCVDNTRAAAIATAIAGKLGVDVSQLPVVATAPEAAMEKAVSIGTWAVARACRPTSAWCRRSRAARWWSRC